MLHSGSPSRLVVYLCSRLHDHMQLAEQQQDGRGYLPLRLVLDRDKWLKDDMFAQSVGRRPNTPVQPVMVRLLRDCQVAQPAGLTESQGACSHAAQQLTACLCEGVRKRTAGMLGQKDIAPTYSCSSRRSVLPACAHALRHEQRAVQPADMQDGSTALRNGLC